MPALRDIASRVADEMVEKKRMAAVQAKAGPFIDIILGILEQLLPVLLSCIPNAKPEAVQERLKAISWYERIFIATRVRRELTLRAFREIGDSLIDEIANQAKAATPEQVAAVLAEYND